jgi:hypothetical protein
MKPSVLYRVAAGLLLLFALGHTLGFRQVNSDWPGTGPLIDSMRSVHFEAQGFDRTYWDFFSGFGFFFTVFLVFAAVLAWQLGRLSGEPVFARMRTTAWAMALCFVAITGLSVRYTFTTPTVFSTLITACLIFAAWRSAKPIAST